MAPDWACATSPCDAITDETRRIYCGMMVLLDQQVGVLVQAMGRRMANTVLFFSSDNGGAPQNGASNAPFRGQKGSLFEGGARQVGFMYAGSATTFPSRSRGATWDGAMHVIDFTATTYRLGSAGIANTGKDHGYMPNLDGIDMWDEISSLASSPRTEVPIWIGDGNGAIRMRVEGIDYKLLLNQEAVGWYTLSTSTGEYLYNEPSGCVSIDFTEAQRQRRGESISNVIANNVSTRAEGGGSCTFLFQIENDQYEENDLLYNSIGSDDYSTYLNIASIMAARLSELNSYAGEMPEYGDEWDGCNEKAATVGFWGPWMDDTGIVSWVAAR